MLDLEDVIKYYPKELHSKKLAMYREYLQYSILNIVFNSKYANKLSFLGGTALRIIHNNARFSEDIDFDFSDLSYEEFSKVGEVVKNELQKLGFDVELKTVKKLAFHCYIKLPKVMYKYGLSPLLDQKLLIQLDAASHGFDYDPEIRTLNKFGIFTDVFVTPIDILLSQKIWAILNRKRPKGRDFYDVVFLFGLTQPNYEYLEYKAGIRNSAELQKELRKHLKDSDFDWLAKDVSPFLFDSEGEKKVKNFLKILE